MNAIQKPIPNQAKSPPGRPKRQPSGRNLELYHELVCEGRPQAEVAARFRISQPRVAKIHGEVAMWVDKLLPADLRGGDAGHRLHLAIALRRLQLARAYEKYLACFGGTSGAAGYGHLLAASDAGVLPQELAADLPRRDFIESALRMARELDDLDRTARRGPLFDLLTADREADAAATDFPGHSDPIAL